MSAIGPRDHYDKEAAELQKLHAEIQAEIEAFNRWFSPHDASKDAFVRRTFFRTIFASIEAYIAHLKRSAMLFTLDRPETFSPGEFLALQDLESFVNDKGKVATKRAKVRMKDNLRFAFHSFAKALNREYDLDFNGEGQSFTEAIKIRDRLTHPKDSSSWVISDADFKCGQEAWKWFGERLVEVSKQGP
jgi:hypothetical protein